MNSFLKDTILVVIIKMLLIIFMIIEFIHTYIWYSHNASPYIRTRTHQKEANSQIRLLRLII